MANIFQRLFRAANFQVGYTGSPGFASHLRGISTKAGANMDEEIALGLSVVYACVQRIASTIAQLEVEVMVYNNGSKRRAAGHPAYALIAEEPEPNYTAYDFWETYVANILIYGKAYAIIRRTPNGDPYEMNIVSPTRVKELIVDGERVYEVKDDAVYLASDVFTIRNMYGKSPIELHRDLLGLAKAAQDFASEFFSSSGNMTGILSSNEPLKKEQYDIIRESWNNASETLGTKLLPFGFKYDRIGVDPSNAQMSEQRQFQNQEICRVFGVPPSIVGVASNVTYNNTEQQAIQFAKYCIVPWTRRIEQEMNLKLIASDERPAYFTRFNLDGLLRGDAESRAKYYDTLVKAGIMSINEARDMEDMNQVPGGSVHLVQVNQLSLDKMADYSAKISSNESTGV